MSFKRKSNSDGKAKKRMNKLYDVPTTEELYELLEVDVVFHSRLFKMEVKELMNETKFKKQDEFSEFFIHLKSTLCSIPKSKSYSVNDTSWLTQPIEIPIDKNPINNKGQFQFLPPSVINVVGSFNLDTLCAVEPVIDVAIEIPHACWQVKDHLNFRYHRKRALYLVYIAQHLLELNIEMKFAYQHECHLKPILLIKPREHDFWIGLTAYPAKTAFKDDRFSTAMNNVRSSWFLQTKKDLLLPTLYYNATILADIMIPELNDYLKEKVNSANVQKGIILLKIWCTQRGLTTGEGRLSGFLLSMFVAYFLNQQRITQHMSAYQVFRCALLAFASENFFERGISLCKDSSAETVQDSKKQGIVFLEPFGHLNMCYNVSKETVIRLQHEAKLGLKMLNEADSFTNLFIKKVAFSDKYEYLAHILGPKKFVKYSKLLKLKMQQLDHGHNVVPLVIEKICDVLRQGLKDRILFIDTIRSQNIPWSLTTAPPDPNKGKVTFGFLLNPDVPLSNLEKGPPANDPQAKVFREFWGEQSELRRFRDGSICEAVLWKAKTVEDRRKVFPCIVSDILKRHISIKPENVTFVGTEVQSALKDANGEEKHILFLEKFNILYKQLRQLEGLPLIISSIQGASAVFRFTDVFPPSPSCTVNKTVCFISEDRAKLKTKRKIIPPLYMPAYHAIIHLEGSGKWPDDLKAIKMVKAAFHIKIAELVQQQFSLVSVPFETHTDILKDGFIFRLEVACRKEIHLLKKMETPEGMLRINETEESQDLERRTQHLPKLNSLLHGVHQQFNSYGTACRLAKRWLSSRLFHYYFPDIAVDLVMAFIYLHPEPYSRPSSPQTAFIRFLQLLALYSWNVGPLIVNFNNELSNEEIEEIRTSFTSQQSSSPVVIVTPFDREGSMWTKKAPDHLILQQLITTAQSSFEKISKQMKCTKGANFKKIFKPCLRPYDILIHLKKDQIPKRCFTSKADNDVECEIKDKIYPVVEYDPVQSYLKDLRETFGGVAYFFYNIYGGKVIAVNWKLEAFESKVYEEPHCNGNLMDECHMVTPDVGAILEDFELLGADLICHIEKRIDQWKIP